MEEGRREEGRREEGGGRREEGGGREGEEGERDVNNVLRPSCIYWLNVQVV